MDPCSKTIGLLAIEYPMKIEGLKSCVLPEWPIRSRDSKFKCLWNSLTRSGFAGICLFFLSRLPAPTSLSGSERRAGEEPGNEFLAALGSHVENSHYNKKLRIAFSANVKLHHVTKVSLYLSFTVYYFYTVISCFMLCSSCRLILDIFFSAHFKFDKLPTFISRLQFAVCPKRDSKSL